ncbi:MAG: exopolysaccharide biosynthesis polyprenyl glycosylphosphotransferase [Pseudomonadota bacterium]|nr:exopolysaccharide biosynthesis polyprenyl glycosylphosphotransferase [Pseudomonadota bacterium]
MARSQLQFVENRPSLSVAGRARAYPRRGAGPSWRLGPLGFGYLAALADALAIVVAALATVLLRMAAFGGTWAGLRTGFDVGLIVAVLVVLAGLHNGGYAPSRYAERSGQFARAFPLWNLTALAALALGVATRAIGDFPRFGLAMFYLLGLAALVMSRRALAGGLTSLHARGLVTPRRIAVVGFEPDIDELALRGDEVVDGARCVCSFALREAETFFLEDLSLAVAAIRLHRADDVFVALPWSRPELIEACLAALTKLPIEVHLGLARPLRGLGRAELAHVGAVAGLTLTRRPLRRLEQIEKRAFDLAVAALALVALSPLLAAVALAIRLEGPGPVLFRQKRYGLNQEPFRIFKFRTMRTMDDGAVVKQATRADARVTRIGAHLRRLSIDELPQLLNVLIGDMSIVGPRPHALAHDQFYFQKLARYARRHNVKPGITGWAQVRGHRGEIADDSAMLARLEHDLYYVDHWSLWLDVKIMFMTVFSRSAHSNAY